MPRLTFPLSYDIIKIVRRREDVRFKIQVQLLQNAAALLKVAFGDYEIYRSGGDEFVVLCPGITSQLLDESITRPMSALQQARNGSRAITTYTQ